MPKGLLEAIKNAKDIKNENEVFNTEFKIDKSNIETYKMEIISK